MASVVQLVRCRAGKTFDVHPKTEGLEAQHTVEGQDGQSATILFWNGGNAFKASVHMEAFMDRSRSMLRRVASQSKWEVASGTCEVVPDAFKAVLFVSGRLPTGTSPTEYWNATEGSGIGAKSSDASSARTAEILLQCREDSTIGAVYTFASSQDLDTFLESAEWKRLRAATPWEDVTVEKFSVAGAVAAASA